MKSIRLFSMAVLSMAMVLISCSGEDGEQGPEGKQGPAGANGIDGVDGADGISCWDLNGNGTGDTEEDINEDGNFDALDCQGEDGTNGVDGNANVQEHAFNLDEFSDYTNLVFSLSDIVDEPKNYAYLYYIEKGDFRISIPGKLTNGQYARVYSHLTDGYFRIDFLDANDNSIQVPVGYYANVIVVTIELTNTSKNSENLMAELKAAGVDTSDYNAVAEYFGLE